MRTFKEIESVGWKFWLVLLALCLYPGYLVAKRITYDINPGIQIGTGVVLAMIVSGVLASAVNEALYRITRRRYNARKKESRKERGKKGAAK